VLRLWPKTWQVSLFPTCSWISHKKENLCLSEEHTCIDMYTAFTQILDERDELFREGDHLGISISDTSARTVLLPWQERLDSFAELEAYARICFEMQGMALDDTWSVYADFPSYRGDGLAYAIPHASLNRLLEIAQKKNLKISEVVPNSARGFYAGLNMKEKGSHLLLLHESTRFSSLLFHDQKVVAYDVEVPTGAKETALTRLFSRIACAHSDIANISYWPLDDALPASEISALTKSFYADAGVTLLPSRWWHQ